MSKRHLKVQLCNSLAIGAALFQGQKNEKKIAGFASPLAPLIAYLFFLNNISN